MAGKPWSSAEVYVTVSDYMAMLECEVRGQRYSKAAHRRELVRLLDGRSEASVEYKHRNISAVLEQLDMRYISGYKPLANIQSSLSESVDHELLARPGLAHLIQRWSPR